jgi:hypothetical protein
MARAQGARAQMALAFETAYGRGAPECTWDIGCVVVKNWLWLDDRARLLAGASGEAAQAAGSRWRRKGSAGKNTRGCCDKLGGG